MLGYRLESNGFTRGKCIPSNGATWDGRVTWDKRGW